MLLIKCNSRTDAILAISSHPERVIAVLAQVLETRIKKLVTSENTALKFSKAQVAALHFWSEVLSSIYRIQKCIQAERKTRHQALN